MAKTATIVARTEPELKVEAKEILKKLGLSTSEAINLFLSQIRLHKGLPFEVRIPDETNKTTLETLRKTKNTEGRRG